MSSDFAVIHRGKKGEACRKFQAAGNRRAEARDLDSYKVKVDGVCGRETLILARKLGWALGAREETYDAILREGEIPIGIQRMVRNPGRRSRGQELIGKKRIAQMRADRKKRAREHHEASGGRKEFVKLAAQAKANYMRNPGAYHYLAGGIANLVFLRPTPRSYRSDCSQFASSVQNAAGLPPLARAGALWVSTYTMAAYLEETDHPMPADFGMYGSRTAPHHVETYCALPGAEFIGHGSPPIDSLTPGRPDFYLKNPIKG